MRLADLPTPCLVLDRAILERNIAAMASGLARHGVPLRPHMKTAKSIDVARLATAGQPGGITVSTLAEAEYFAGHGISDILYAVGITPQKLDQVAKLNSVGAAVIVLTDDLDTAGAIAAHRQPPRALIEIDTGEGRGGDRSGRRPAAGDRRAARPVSRRRDDACRPLLCRPQPGRHGADRRGRAGRRGARRRTPARGRPCRADRLDGQFAHRAACARLDGVTEVRAGVYMFGDLFQAEIGTHGLDAIALTVLTSVIGRRPGRLLVDAGGLALSKDRSTADAPKDYGFGLVLDLAGAAQPRRCHRAPRLPGTRRGGGRSGASARSAGRREAADRAESHLHDRGGA